MILYHELCHIHSGEGIDLLINFLKKKIGVVGSYISEKFTSHQLSILRSEFSADMEAVRKFGAQSVLDALIWTRDMAIKKKITFDVSKLNSRIERLKKIL